MKRSLILLNNINNLSLSKVTAIVDYFKDPDNIFKASRRDFFEVADLGQKDVDNISSLIDSQWLTEELKMIERQKIDIVDLFSKDYPLRLKEIASPPLVLYIKGNKALLNEFCFAIVGTRMATSYGLSMAQKFARDLSGLGLVIISGLAKGIDTASHKAALKVGSTVAVLGSGFLNIYPRENKALAGEIVENGALVSEFPLRVSPKAENFPRRNRIISGLSRGVLVVEAARRSGALITARFALEQNREVFALPGGADSPLSKGAHFLIKEGAKLVDSLQDIIEELNIDWSGQNNKLTREKDG